MNQRLLKRACRKDFQISATVEFLASKSLDLEFFFVVFAKTTRLSVRIPAFSAPVERDSALSLEPWQQRQRAVVCRSGA